MAQVITTTDRNIASGSGQPSPAPSSVPQAGSPSDSFGWLLFFVASVIVLLGAYESFTQAYLPGSSILARAHSLDLLTQYELTYGPSDGIWHMLGWTGSVMMIVMMLYSVRKRAKFLRNFGSLRHWLAAHMFLGIVGPLLVTLHTTFQFHGIIATSFWCMITTMVFGILGRYIYIQIPRSVSGTELGVQGIEKVCDRLDRKLEKHLSEKNISSLLAEISATDGQLEDMSPISALLFMMKTDIRNRFKLLRLKAILKQKFKLPRKVRRDIAAQLSGKAALIRKIHFLKTSHSLLHYWHVLHIPLAAVMFLIMFLHIVVYFVFRPAI